MMFRKMLVALACLTLAQPAKADDTSPVVTIWDLFVKHCGQYAASKTPADMIAAFKPHQLELIVSTDGKMFAGGVTITDAGIGSSNNLTFSTHELRLRGGQVRTCFLVMHNFEGVDLKGLTSHAQMHAGALIGEDYYVVGGAGVSRGKIDDLNVSLNAPGFPPLKSLNVAVSRVHASVILNVAVPEAE